MSGELHRASLAQKIRQNLHNRENRGGDPKLKVHPMPHIMNYHVHIKRWKAATETSWLPFGAVREQVSYLA